MFRLILAFNFLGGFLVRWFLRYRYNSAQQMSVFIPNFQRNLEVVKLCADVVIDIDLDHYSKSSFSEPYRGTRIAEI